MRNRIYLPALLLAAVLAGALAGIAPLAVLAAPKEAPCAVCSVKEGAGPEPVRATASYQGKEYAFCREECKKEFLKNLLLDFWATFCGPCIKAMPKLQKLHDEYSARGFSVVGISTDEEGAKVVAPMVADQKVKYPVLISDEATWKAYGVETLPALFLVNRQGQIVRRFGGGTDHKTIEREVRSLLEERTDAKR